MGYAIDGVQVTADAAELNKMDDSSATATELDYTDIATLGAQEANKVVTTDSNVNSGVSKVTAQSIGTSGSEVLQEAALLAPSDLTQIDQTALQTVGRIYTAPDGKAYVYLLGVASVVVGDVVSYIVTTPSAATTKRLVGDAVGHVGVAMGAVIAGDFGWFQIAGLNLDTVCDSSAAIGAAYIGGTTAAVDHNAAVGDLIHGMQIVVADSSGKCGVFMTYPSVTDKSGL